MRWRALGVCPPTILIIVMTGGGVAGWMTIDVSPGSRNSFRLSAWAPVENQNITQRSAHADHSSRSQLRFVELSIPITNRFVLSSIRAGNVKQLSDLSITLRDRDCLTSYTVRQ